MWPIKEEENKQLFNIVAKSYPLDLAVKMLRFGCLFNINPSGLERPSSSFIFLLSFPKAQGSPVVLEG